MMKLELSPQAEQAFQQSLLELVGNFLELHDKPAPRLLGLISRQQAMAELGIKRAQTFREWEKLGLRTYHPPLEDTRTIFYKVSDLLTFLGVEDERSGQA